MDSRPRNDGAELKSRLAELHRESADLIDEAQTNAKQQERLRIEIERVRYRLKVLRGERKGGRPRGATGVGTSISKIHAVLEAEPSREWSNVAVAAQVGLTPHEAATLLSRLVASGRAVRIRRAVYRGARPGETKLIVPRPVSCRATMEAKVATAVSEDLSRIWLATTLVELGLANNLRQAAATLSDLCAKRVLRRISRGVYANVQNTSARDPRSVRPPR